MTTDGERTGLGISLKPESKISQRQRWSKYCQAEFVCVWKAVALGRRPGVRVASGGSR